MRLTMSIKTALITGCSTGIGRALANEFLQQGYKVYATARSLNSLSNFQHPNLVALSLDVNNQSDIKHVVETINNDSGYLTVLVNNAGFAAMGPVAELSQEKLQQQFATNVFAPIALTQAFLPLLRNNNQEQASQIVNIGSVSGIVTTPYSGAYCATKSALHSLSDALRMELKPFNIDVITVQPGSIESEFGNNSLKNLADLIGPNSLYAPLKKHIKARAMASQQNPTPAAKLAEILVKKLQNNPKPELPIGNGSCLLPLLKGVLSTRMLDKILRKKFGLSGLIEK